MIEGNGENEKPEIKTPFDGYQDIEKDYYLEGVVVRKIDDALDHGKYKVSEIEKMIKESFDFASGMKDDVVRNRTMYRIFNNISLAGFSFIAKDRLSLITNEILRKNLESSMKQNDDYMSYIERIKYDKAYILDHEDKFERDEIHRNLRDISNEEMIFDIYRKGEENYSEDDYRFLELLLGFGEGLEKQRTSFINHEEHFSRVEEKNAPSLFYRCEIFERLFNPDASSNMINGRDSILSDIEAELNKKGRKIDNNEAFKAWEYVNDQISILIESIYGKQDY